MDLNKRHQNKQKKKEKRQAKQHCPCKLRIWQNVLQDFVVFSRSFTTSSLSSQALHRRKTVLSFVVVDLGLAGMTEAFFKLLIVSVETLSTVFLSERHRTQRTGQKRGFLSSTGTVTQSICPSSASDCCVKLQTLTPQHNPPALPYSSPRGLLSPCPWNPEVMVFGVGEGE